MDRSHGFTLIEATICLVVASILAAIAVPAVADAMARSNSASARAALLTTITAAIGHASTTGTEVVICPSAGDGCRKTMDWSGGWIAYADLDGDRLHSAGDTLVTRVDALDDVRLFSTKGRKRLFIQPTGGNAGSNVTFTLCDGRGRNRPVTLVMANDGRLRAGTARMPCPAR